MSAISLKSITGITSITTPAGVDNQLTLHNNNTSEAVKLDTAGNIHINNQLAVTGVSTFSDDVTLQTANSNNILLDKSDNSLKFGDSTYAKFGGSGELMIYHDGNYSVIKDTNSSPFNFEATGTITFAKAGLSETYAKMIPDGAVELYHNGSKKFETTSAAANFTVASNGQVNLFGLGGTNGLRISGPQSASSAFLFFNTNHQNVSGGTDQYTIQCGGANHTLMFKHGNSTGNVVFELDDTEHVRIPQDNKALKIGAGQDLVLYHNGSHSFIDSTLAGGQILIRTRESGGTINNSAKFMPTGAVELYYDGTKRLETTSLGISVSGQGIFSSAITASTYIQGTSSNGGLKFYSDSSASKGVVLNTDDHLVPSHDSSSDLGLTGTRWRNVYADTLYGDGSNLTGITGTTINNNADNRVITGSGTANTLEGEATLTYNGSVLNINNTSNEKIILAGSDNPYIRFRSGSTDKGYIQMHSNGNMYLVNQATSELLKIGSGAGGLTFTHGGTESVVAHAGYLSNDAWYQEYGKSYVGNFGQFQGHSTYQNFNTDVSYWGWNFVNNNNNAPNTSSAQWYRGRFSLGDSYGYGSAAGDYWLEMAIPRYNYGNAGGPGQMYVRTCENGSIQGWREVGTRVRDYVLQNGLIHFDAKLTSGTSSGVLKFNNVQENVGSGYNSSTGRFTAPVGGVYVFTGAILQTNSSAQFDANIRYNGATSTKGQSMRIAGVSGHTTLQITETLKLNVNDYVDVEVSSGGVHLGGSGNWAGWQGTLLG